jgi:hypothetical protein
MRSSTHVLIRVAEDGNVRVGAPPGATSVSGTDTRCIVFKSSGEIAERWLAI